MNSLKISICKNICLILKKCHVKGMLAVYFYCSKVENLPEFWRVLVENAVAVLTE